MSQSSSPKKAQKKKALVFTPSAAKGKMLQALLADQGYLPRIEKEDQSWLSAWDPSSGTQAPDLLVIDEQCAPVGAYPLLRGVSGRRREARPRLILFCAEVTPDRRFRGLASGADLVLPADPDEWARLEQKLSTPPPSRTTAPSVQPSAADAAQAPEGDLLTSLLHDQDEALYRLQISDQLRQASHQMASLEETARQILETLPLSAEVSVGVLILLYQKHPLIFALPAPGIYRQETEEFIDLCREDFLRKPQAEGLRTPQTVILGVRERQDFEKTRLDGRRISSYQTEELSPSENTFIGTLHAGSLVNNYFTGRVAPRVRLFAQGAALTLHNALKYTQTESTRQRIEQIFAKFVPREVIHDLLDHSDDAELQLGEKRHLAILFSDIRSFTVISENNSAENIVDLLNRYFDRMSQAIRAQGGFIDKFIGDAILAVFGAPVSYKDNALRAVKAALAMEDALADVDTQGLKLPEGGFNIGIGVHEGPVIVGNIGSRDKFDYTVIGDNVNLASRLEGLTKHYRQRIMVSDVLAQSLGDELFLRQVDTVKVKGKSLSTTLYAVHRKADLPPGPLHDYTKGLQMEKLGNWNLAVEFFQKVMEAVPGDFLSLLHRDRCREYRENPPKKWDGAMKLDFK